MRTSRRSSLAGAGKIPGCPLGETMSIKQRFEQEPIYLMDGSAFVYRGFYANQSMQRSDGFPTSALFIVARILMRILREEQPKHFAFVLDGHGPNFRHELFPLYKAQRSATPEDLIKQIDPIHRLIKALGLEGKRICVVIGNEDIEAFLSFRNIPEVNILPVGDINTYELVYNKAHVIAEQ